MSSPPDNRSQWEARFLFVVCLIALVWYADPQLRETIYFPLQVVRALIPGFPDLLP